MESRINKLTWIICGAALLWLLLWTSGAIAAPYLQCDVDENCQYYKVYANGTLIVSNSPAPLNYDLSETIPAAINFTAECCNYWGCSEVSDPFLSLGAPGKPINLNLTP